VAKISINKFSGAVPLAAPRLLSDEVAHYALNCNVSNGNLRPIKGAQSTFYGLHHADDESFVIHRLEATQPDGTVAESPTLFSWERDVDFHGGPLINDEHNRFYYSGDEYPKVGAANTALSTTNRSPDGYHMLGVPSPRYAPRVSLEGAVVADDIATGSLVINADGAITDAVLITSGSGFSGYGVVNIIEPLGEGGAVSLTISMPGGEIGAATVTAGGTGYSEGNINVIAFDGHGNGTGATLTPVIAPDGSISRVDVTAPGSGYSSAATATIETFGGSGANISAVVADGEVKELVLIDPGSDYASGASLEVVHTNTVTEEIPVTRAYVYTLVNQYGEESAPSPVSDMVDWEKGLSVRLRDIRRDTADTTNRNYSIVRVRIYRYVQAASGGVMAFVEEISADAGEYLDPWTDLELPGGELETQDVALPPEDMVGLTMLANGVMAGFRDNEVCFCEPYMPYSWPLKYRMAVEHKVVALGSVGNGVTVLTQGQPSLITGNHPSVMTMAKLAEDQSCASKRSVAAHGGSVMFASPDGMILVSNGGATNVTEDLIERDYWKSLNPTTITGVYHEGQYIGLHETGGFILDMLHPDRRFIELSIIARGVYRDLITDTLYLSLGSSGVEVVSWNADAGNPLEYVWTSKVFDMPSAIPLSCGRVKQKDDGPVTIKVFTDGDTVPFHEETFGTNQGDTTPNTMFRLPPGLAEEWQIELTGTAEIESVELASSPEELF
jgi:hypothetical protein